MSLEDNPERWARINDLYHAALERNENERVAFLTETCGEDEALVEEVLSLLRFDANEKFLTKPALEIAAQLGTPGGPLPSLIGRTIGRHKVISLLGAGGMGDVYLSHDMQLD